ncbi:hypothetical protein [Longispora urticae]
MPADPPTPTPPQAPIQPIVAPRQMPVLPDRVWSQRDWARIQLGYLASDMDEKWNVSARGDVVSFHRSWTGNQTYEATFAPAGDGWRISGAVVESSPERYRAISDEFDCVLLELILSAIVLGEPAAELCARLVALSAPPTDQPSVPAGLILHSLLGLRTSRVDDAHPALPGRVLDRPGPGGS